jgi:hypothetical protein
MDIRTTGVVQRRIDAGPAAVYALISDVTRTGEWSPNAGAADGSTAPTGPHRAHGSEAGTVPA